jgi:transposase
LKEPVAGPDRGKKGLTPAYQIDGGRKRLLGVIRDRDTRSLTSFFETFGAERCARIKVVCSDMWKPCLNVIAVMLPAALNVLDRFHIAKKLGEAVDEVRRQEAKQLAAAGYELVLKNSRYCFLKRRSNLTIRQATKLRDLLKYDLKSLRALALKEAFDGFWQYESPRWAELAKKEILLEVIGHRHGRLRRKQLNGCQNRNQC